MYPVVFLLGLHGSGKTSVGRLLETSHGFKHLSVGDLGRLARNRRPCADVSLRLMCMLMRQTPDQTLLPAVVEELLQNVATMSERTPVSVDGFPAEPSHLELIPPAAHVLHLHLLEETRQERLYKRSLNGPRKWTPGMRSVRDEALPNVLNAGSGRIVEIDAAQELPDVVKAVLAKI